MVAKTQILGELGERTVLLPALIEEGLAANDRLKIRLSLLQEAAAQASRPGRGPPSMDRELNSVGLTDPFFNTTVSGARQIDADTFHAPGADQLGAGLNRTAKLAFGHPGLAHGRPRAVAEEAPSRRSVIGGPKRRPRPHSPHARREARIVIESWRASSDPMDHWATNRRHRRSSFRRSPRGRLRNFDPLRCPASQSQSMN